MHPFEALAEPVRRRIVEILASGEHTAGQIADVVGYEFRISRTAVSKHLRLLRDARCVDVRAEENWRWYRIDRAGFEALEHAVMDLKSKTLTAIGWDADAGEMRDPLAGMPRVPYKGAGRPPRRGRRGKQTATARSNSPDDTAPLPRRIALPYSPRDPEPSAEDLPRLEP